MRAGVMARALGFLVTNRVTMWFCAGVCKSQMALIKNEDNIYSYIVRCLDNVAKYSNLRDSNYFYRLCLTGRFARHCCPRFLEEDCFARLKHELAAGERLLIRTDSFVSQLCARQYTKVILMDHVDWLDQPDIDTLAAALKAQVRPGGRVIWRSASKQPHYARAIEAAGFKGGARFSCRAADLFAGRQPGCPRSPGHPRLPLVCWWRLWATADARSCLAARQ